jgi:Mg-chelatase subunit ChlD
MIRWWAFWRRVEYALGATFLMTLVSVGVYYAFMYVGPTCFDRMANGDERGMDCGGVCTRVCRIDISAPKVLWVSPFKIMDGQYNIVAYIENANREVGTGMMPYTMTLSDAEGVIVERHGTTVLPPDGTYPIFEGRVMTGTRIPTEATIAFENEDDVVWVPATIGRDQFFLEERDLTDADSAPRLTAQVRNELLEETREVEIVATIFNSSGKPLTAARTVVEYFRGRTTEKVVFTWPQPIATTLRSCEVPTDVILAIDLSGSMDSDGGNPPEPLTSVLAAAESFVTRMKEEDQIGVVTFATGASVVSPLTSSKTSVASEVSQLTIDPVEQRGSTNPGEALKKTYDEILSPRHNNDARKIAVLFTDGLANAPEKNAEGYATSTANELKKKGVDLFTIGLGASVNQKFLQEIASSPKNSFIAPTSGDVDSIYKTITTAICEDGATVIEVIAKPTTSFE